MIWGLDARGKPPHDLLLDLVDLAADPRREVAAPAVVERGYLEESGGLAVGDPVAEPGSHVVGESLENLPIIGP